MHHHINAIYVIEKNIIVKKNKYKIKSFKKEKEERRSNTSRWKELQRKKKRKDPKLRPWIINQEAQWTLRTKLEGVQVSKCSRPSLEKWFTYLQSAPMLSELKLDQQRRHNGVTSATNFLKKMEINRKKERK